MKIPASSPIISERDKQAVIKAVEKGWFTEGLQCNLFGKSLSRVTGKNLVQLVNSGSSANLLAITAAVEKWNTGKMVITSAVGFPTTVAPIYQNNKIPVFVDIDLKTLSPDIGQIAYLIDKHGYDISGGIFAHTLGFPYDERLVRTLLGDDRFLIADNCDAIGATVYGKRVGYWADMTTYSFFPAHHITTGEGGAVLTDDDELFNILRSYANWGRDCYCQPGQQNVCGKRFSHDFPTLSEGYDHKYTFTRLGYNLKMTELQAAMGVTQMQEVEDWALQRFNNYMKIADVLYPFKEYMQIVGHEFEFLPSPFGYPVIMNIQGYTQDLINYLEKRGISTRRIFGGNIAKQPAFAGLPHVKLDLENSDWIMENAFWIGCGPWMNDNHIEWIEEVFTDWFDEKGFL